MTNYFKLAATLTTGTLLGCTQMSSLTTQNAPNDMATKQRANAVLRIEPFQRSTSMVSEVEGLYLSARAAHGSGQLALAEAGYAKVLAQQPAHIGALNALAVIYAQSDRLEQSLELLGRAANLEPQAAHVHNNFGYALLLANRLPQAEAEFQTALSLNPNSAMTQKNMALLAQAKSRLPVEVAAIVATPTAPATANATPAQALTLAVGPSLVTLSPNVYELRAAPKAAVLTAKAVEPQLALKLEPTTLPMAHVTAASLTGVRIEVSNGVGIRYLARRTAERLAPLGLVAARLTNQPGYKQAKTEIQYNVGQVAAADALASKLPVAVALNPRKELGRNVQMRLVLGHDLAGQAIARWVEGQVATQLALSRLDGWLWS